MKQKEEYKIDYDSQNIPASVKELKPKLYKHEGNWCALSGENLANGIVRYGATPDEALQDFDVNYAKIKETSV